MSEANDSFAADAFADAAEARAEAIRVDRLTERTDLLEEFEKKVMAYMDVNKLTTGSRSYGNVED